MENTKNIQGIYQKFERVDPPVIKVDNRRPIVNYGADNQYPDFLASLPLQSTTHSAFIDVVTKGIVGKKIEIFKADGVTHWKQAQRAFDKWDKKEITFRQSKAFAKDLAMYNGVSCIWQWSPKHIEVLTDFIKGTPTGEQPESYGFASYTPFKDWRSGTPNEVGDVDTYYHKGNWSKRDRAEPVPIPAYDPDTVVVAEGDTLTTEATQLLYLFEPNNVSGVYPVPYYMSGIYSILSEGQLSMMNYNAIINGFQADGILVVPSFDKPEDSRKFESDLRGNFTGAENARKVLLYESNGGVDELKPEWIPINSTDNPDTRIALANEFAQRISTAHGSPSTAIVGQIGSTGFSSNADELIMAYNIFQEKTIQDAQQTLESLLQFFFENGIPEFKDAVVKIKPLDFEGLLGYTEQTTQPNG